MLRLVGYFVVVIVTLAVLREIPVVGAVFRIPLVGFFLALAVVGTAAERFGRAALHRARFGRMRRDLGAVDTPHNRGKLGMLLLGQRRFAQAIGHLEVVTRNEPQSADWNYRLGCAYLGAGRASEAAVVLQRSLELNPEQAYGAGWLRLAEARQAEGEYEGALAASLEAERSQGATPEQTYRKALALKALGRRDEARAAFAEVSRVASEAPRYQRGAARVWVTRAVVAKLFS